MFRCLQTSLSIPFLTSTVKIFIVVHIFFLSAPFLILFSSLHPPLFSPLFFTSTTCSCIYNISHSIVCISGQTSSKWRDYVRFFPSAPLDISATLSLPVHCIFTPISYLFLSLSNLAPSLSLSLSLSLCLSPSGSLRIAPPQVLAVEESRRESFRCRLFRIID